MWIAGDANLPDIAWNRDSIIGNRYPRLINETFISLKQELGMSQIVDFPTREKSILEVFLTNRPSLIQSCIATPGISDHDTIALIESKVKADYRKPPKRKIYLWKQADILTLRKETLKFSHELTIQDNTTTDIDELWSKFTGYCHAAIEKHVPSKTSSERFHQAWINTKIKRLSQRKKRAYRKAKRTDNPDDWEVFRTLKKNLPDRMSQYIQHLHRWHADW